MTSQQFSDLLHDPGLLNDQTTGLIEDLVLRYPYCQSLNLLLAYNYFVEESPSYPGQLKIAAACAGDRRILRELIGHRVKPDPDNEKTISYTAPVNRILIEEPEIRVPDHVTLPYERMTQEELLSIVKNRLAEIAQSATTTGNEPGSTGQVFNVEPPAAIDAKTLLIDKFIREEPRISKPKSAFFSPSESAIRSNMDEEEIVSETLARLYAEQGNIQKAIHIYEKLSLINQEKSRYFAAQIKNLDS